MVRVGTVSVLGRALILGLIFALAVSLVPTSPGDQGARSNLDRPSLTHARLTTLSAITTSTVPAPVRGFETAMGLRGVGPMPYLGPSPRLRQASNLYVSNLGSDTAPCTSSEPCRQISEALSLVEPGETIFVTNGTFLGFDVNSILGTKAEPIIIESPGRASVLTPTVNRSDNRDTVHFVDSDNVTLDGFQSYDANRAAVRIDTSNNITVSNCTFGNDTTWGIFTDFDHNSTIVHNTVYGSVQQHGIYVSNSPLAPVVKWNLLYNNSGAGLQINADATQGGWGISDFGDIEDNVIYNNGASGGAGINLDGNWNSRVVNNLLYDNHATGIVNYVADGFAGPQGMEILDNTVVMASNGRWALQFEESTGPNFVRNNILDNLNPAHGGLEFGNITDVNDTDSDYNILGSVTVDSTGNIYTLTQWQGMGHEPHSLSATPVQLFVDANTSDYQLLASSPAIKTGVYLPNVTTDIVGDPRPVGPSDIGCYQYVSARLAAGATASPTTGSAPLTVNFTGGATGGTSPYHYLWTFGDGVGSNLSRPTHVFTTVGTFNVSLQVTDSTGQTASANLTVTVTAVASLMARASATPSDGVAPLSVLFNGTASGGIPPYTFAWGFADGTPHSAVRNPTHTFVDAGTYTVTLWLTDTDGGNATSTTTVVVSAPPASLAALIAGPTALEVDTTATFQVNVTGGTGGDLISWNFGDGSGWSATSSSLYAIHSYAAPGTYVVQAWVNDSSGSSVLATSLSVHVAPDTSSGPPPPTPLSPFLVAALALSLVAAILVVVVVLRRRGARSGSPSGTFSEDDDARAGEPGGPPPL